MATAQGQTPDPTPDPILEAAQREAALAKANADKAESEKKTAEAERDKLKAAAQPFGTPNITAPSGDVSTDSSGFVETQILGQEAARVITSRFAQELTGVKPKPQIIIIYSGNDITAVSAYMPVLLELRQFNAELTTSHTEAVKKINAARVLLLDIETAPQMDPLTLAMAAPAIATGAVKSVAELAQLFRSTTKFSNKDVTIPEDTVVSYLVNYMNGVRVFYPSLFPVNLSKFADKTELSDEFDQIQSNKLIAADDIKQITAKVEELAKLKTALKAKLETVKGNLVEEQKINGQISKIDQRITVLGEIKNKIQFLVDSAELITKNLETPDPTTKITPLAQLVRSSHLQTLMNTNDAYTLRFNVTANGTTKIKQWIIFDAKVRHSAGARVSYQLFDKDGMLVKANSFQFYFDWKSSKEVRACLDKPCISEDEKTQNYVKIP